MATIAVSPVLLEGATLYALVTGAEIALDTITAVSNITIGSLEFFSGSDQKETYSAAGFVSDPIGSAAQRLSPKLVELIDAREITKAAADLGSEKAGRLEKIKSLAEVGDKLLDEVKSGQLGSAPAGGRTSSPQVGEKPTPNSEPSLPEPQRGRRK